MARCLGCLEMKTISSAVLCFGGNTLMFCLLFPLGMYAGHPILQVVGPVDRARSKVLPPSTSLQWHASAYHCVVWLWMPIFLGSRFAFQYNPSLQPRALVVFGCISKRVSHGQIKQIIRILSKASPLLSIDRVRSSCLPVAPHPPNLPLAKPLACMICPVWWLLPSFNRQCTHLCLICRSDENTHFFENAACLD